VNNFEILCELNTSFAQYPTMTVLEIIHYALERHFPTRTVDISQMESYLRESPNASIEKWKPTNDDILTALKKLNDSNRKQ